MAIITIVLALAVVAFCLWMFKSTRSRRTLPPGVRDFSAIIFLARAVRTGIVEESSRLMRKLDTDLVSIDLFSLKTIIVFGSQRKVVEAYHKNGEALLRRSPIPAKPDTDGFVSSTGETWKLQRRFLMSTLHKLGMGKEGFETRILDETQRLLDVFNETKGRNFDPRNTLGTTSLNVIYNIIFSSSFEYGDPALDEMMENFTVIVSGSVMRAMSTLVLFEWFFKLPLIKRKLAERRLKTDKSRDVMRARMDEARQRIATAKVTENGRVARAGRKTLKRQNSIFMDRDDAANSYVKEWLWQQTKNDGVQFTDQQLLDGIEDLFGGGTETTSSILRWSLLLMAHNQGIQEKVYQELRDEIGVDHAPRYSERDSTPYTNAVIDEIHRFVVVTPANYRLNDETLTIWGYTFEPGTNFIANSWHLSRDDKVWERPLEFYPEHFIDEQGRAINQDKFSPFGVGKRQCPAESLGRMEVYVVLTSLLLKFRFLPPEGEMMPPMDQGNVGILRSAPPFKIRAVERDE